MKNRIILVCFLILSAVCIGFSYNASKQKNLQDGIWNGSAAGMDDKIEVSVTVKDGKITDAKIESIKEADFAIAAANEIIAGVVSKGSIKKIDVVSGATVTSKATIAALNDAVSKACGDIKEEKQAVVKDESCDIVIIGAGGAGLTAATAARLQGASVIVLEKMPVAGGNTNYATGGLNASETSVQKKLGIEDSNEQYFEDTMKGGYNINDEKLVRTMVEKSAETVDWLMANGADLTDVGKMAGSTNKRTHRPEGGAAVGAHLVPVLEKAAKEAGVDIRFNSKVTDLINSDGMAKGVKVETAAGSYIISSKAVIIATGGFGANPEIIESYKPELEGFGTTNHKGATGDALQWIKQFDAALVDMEQIQTHPTVVPVKNIMITEAVRGNGAIMINRDGKRFGSEMATRDVMSNAILAQEGKTAYLVFDQGVRESLKAIETYSKQGLLIEGATVRELAEKLNIEPSVLEETFIRYNGFVRNGNDDDFNRNASDMPLELIKAPFYAVEVGPAVHHTMGGIKINADAQVLKNDGSVIEGLFAAGEVTGGVHGANRLGGNAVADITVFGKIAGENAAKYAEGK